MKSSGSILRGHLRPMGARSPPFLLIGLLVILGILGFNYWNLSYEYDAIIKEIAELQDHLRIAVLKKENADKQSEALEKRFREAEEQLGKVKINSDQRMKEMKELQSKIEEKSIELSAVKTQYESCHLANSKLNSTREIADNLQKKVLQLESEKSDLGDANHRLTVERQDLRLKVEEMQVKLSTFAMMEQQNEMMRIPAAAASGMNVTEVNDQGMPQLHLGGPRNGSNNLKQPLKPADNSELPKQKPDLRIQPLEDNLIPPIKTNQDKNTGIGPKPEAKPPAQEINAVIPIDLSVPTKPKPEDQHSKNDLKPDTTNTTSKDQGGEDIVGGDASNPAEGDTNDIPSVEKKDTNKELNGKDTQQVLNGSSKEVPANEVKAKDDVDGKQADKGLEFDGMQQKDYDDPQPFGPHEKVGKPNEGLDEQKNKDDGNYNGNELEPPPLIVEPGSDLLLNGKGGGNELPAPVQKPENLMGPEKGSDIGPEKAHEIHEIKWQPKDKIENGGEFGKGKEIL